MFFIPFLVGAAIIGGTAYVISQVIRNKKPIKDISILRNILRNSTQIDYGILSKEISILDRTPNYVDVGLYNNDVIRIEAPFVSYTLKPGMKC